MNFEISGLPGRDRKGEMGGHTRVKKPVATKKQPHPCMIGAAPVLTIQKRRSSSGTHRNKKTALEIFRSDCSTMLHNLQRARPENDLMSRERRNIMFRAQSWRWSGSRKTVSSLQRSLLVHDEGPEIDLAVADPQLLSDAVSLEVDRPLGCMNDPRYLLGRTAFLDKE